MGVTSIKVLIDHVIAEGNRLFPDTRYADTWVIYALPQWWETAAQKYLASKGFAERQWRARGERHGTISKQPIMDAEALCQFFTLLPQEKALLADSL